MASVAGRCPASGVHHPASSGVRRSNRPVSSPSSVRSPGFVVRVSGGPALWCPPVRCPALRCPPVQRPAGWCPPRRSGRASVSSHTGRWRWAQVGTTGTRHHGNGSSPVGCRAVQRFGRRPSRPGRGRCCRARVLVSGASVADPGRVGYGGGACPLSDQAGQAGVRSARRWRRALWAQDEAAARGGRTCRVAAVGGWVATTVGGGRGACRPGGRARRGQ
jgi:hypothetical protein